MRMKFSREVQSGVIWGKQLGLEKKTFGFLDLENSEDFFYNSHKMSWMWISKAYGMKYFAKFPGHKQLAQGSRIAVLHVENLQTSEICHCLRIVKV